MWIPGGYAQVNLKWTGNGVPLGAQTTFGVTCPIGAIPADVMTPVNQALQFSDFCAQMSNEVSITSILVKVGPNETGPMGESASNYPGKVVSTPVPPNVAILVKKATALGGRKAQGRLFLPGAPENQVSSGGQLNPPHVDALQATMDKFLQGLTTYNSAMHLLHTLENSPVPPYPVMRLDVNPLVATQRRRLRG